jgi:hypothetical protein
MQQWRWVAPHDLPALGEQYFPEDLNEIMAEVTA